jgi:hypothetical protein
MYVCVYTHNLCCLACTSDTYTHHPLWTRLYDTHIHKKPFVYMHICTHTHTSSIPVFSPLTHAQDTYTQVPFSLSLSQTHTHTHTYCRSHAAPYHELHVSGQSHTSSILIFIPLTHAKKTKTQGTFLSHTHTQIQTRQTHTHTLQVSRGAIP